MIFWNGREIRRRRDLRAWAKAGGLLNRMHVLYYAASKGLVRDYTIDNGKQPYLTA